MGRKLACTVMSTLVISGELHLEFGCMVVGTSGVREVMSPWVGGRDPAQCSLNEAFVASQCSCRLMLILVNFNCSLIATFLRDYTI